MASAGEMIVVAYYVSSVPLRIGLSGRSARSRANARLASPCRES